VDECCADIGEATMRTLAALTVSIVLVGGQARAQTSGPSSSESATARPGVTIGACTADIRTLCPNIQPGEDRLRDCMDEHLYDASYLCVEALAKFAEVDEARSDCRGHLQQQCGSVQRGGGQFEACLKSAVASLSDSCKSALARAAHRAR
jgi:hypothetical protein